MNAAPIVIFTYKRPSHFERMVNSLKKNTLLDESDILIYCDGPHNIATEEDLKNIERTRVIARNLTIGRQITLIERETNWGLATSIINGVTDVLRDYGKAIVIEDDLILSPGFLQYMNEGLRLYQNIPEVMHISGYMFPIQASKLIESETFFYNTASCWGWGTWDSAWNRLTTDPDYLYEAIQAKDPGFRTFNLENNAGFLDQLRSNISGDITTWNIKWYGSIFLNNGLCLHPATSLVNNIGLDGSGENCGVNTSLSEQGLAAQIQVEEIEMRECPKIRTSMVEFYKKNQSKKQKLKSLINRMNYPMFNNKMTLLKKVCAYLRNEFKTRRYMTSRRYTPKNAIVGKKKITIADSLSFYHQHKEIFLHEIYKMRGVDPNPLFIDGGANIGLASIYLKERYPDARIIAFEPDPEVYSVLHHNLKDVFNYPDVKLIPKGLWKDATEMDFHNEGADAGCIKETNANETSCRIQTDTLSSYLHEPVDFLKLDIEGAESQVLEEAEHQLYLVKRIFVEYHSYTGNEQYPDRIFTILKNSGFRIYAYSSGPSNKSPLFRIKKYADIDNQMNIFGVRD